MGAILRLTMQFAYGAVGNVVVFFGLLSFAGCGSTSSTQPVSKIAVPSVLGSVVPSASYELDAFDVQGNYAYVLGDNGNQGSGSSAAQLYVVDVTHPASMMVVSTTPVIGSVYYGESEIRAQGQYVYLASSTGAANTNLLQIYDVSNPAAPAFVGSVSVPLYAIGLWVAGNYAYVISYVNVASTSTLAIVDVSRPASPAIVGSADTGTAGVNVADIKVVGNYAYVSGQANGQSEILVFNVGNPASPYLLSSLPVAHSPQGLDVEGSYLYETLYDQHSLNIYDITNPSALVQVGTAPLAATCKPQDVSVNGSTAYVACYTDSTIAVVDVTKPASPSVKEAVALPATSYPIFVESKGAYTYSASNTPGGLFTVIGASQ